MINLLRAEFRRLLKSKALIVAPIVATVLVLFSALVLSMSDASAGAEVPGALVRYTSTAHDLIAGAAMDGNLILFVILFAALFVASDFKSGTVKNAVVCGAPKPFIYLSRLITVFVFGIGLLFVCIIAATIFGYALMPRSPAFSAEEVASFFRGLFINIWIVAAMASICTCLSFLVRSTGAAITISVVFYFALSLIVLLISLLSGTNVSIYTLSGIQSIATALGEYQTEEILSVVLVPLSLIILSNLLGILSFEKRDVK
ncbi:MAG: ABC transporter permease [Clostridiaceae bacterium]|jgi:ABC-2 type transport system permease protein|nr:ABC transporter permease [Clostridiaceae bacterium]